MLAMMKMLGVSLCDHITNLTLRQMSFVKAVVVAIKESKSRWVD